MYYDIHCHILPGIDDGSPNVETSLKMVEQEKKDGIGCIVCTPHFYLSEQSIDSFLENRQRAYEKLVAALPDNSPQIYMGAEVLYTQSLSGLDIKKLCMGNTKYMLIELPYQRLTESFIRSFKSFLGEISHEVMPILAHAERYLSFTDADSIYKIMESDMLVQVNCGSFKPFTPQMKFISGLIRSDAVHLLGTDCHNISSRKPNLSTARKYIEKKYGSQLFEHFMKNAAAVVAG